MLADNLRMIRKEHKLTQKNVADVLGMDRTTYTFYELGATTPSPLTLYKLSQIYNVTIGFLMGVEENRPELKKEEETSNFVSQENEKFSYLKKEERELMAYFRVLKPEYKDKLLEYIKTLANDDENDV